MRNVQDEIVDVIPEFGRDDYWYFFGEVHDLACGINVVVIHMEMEIEIKDK